MTKNTIFLGKAAELMFVAKCLIEGLECYLPVGESGRVDVIVGGRLKKCQVKVISQSKRQGGLWIRKAGGLNYKSYVYAPEDVDFIIGVDLITMDIYVAPIEKISDYKAVIGIQKLCELGFKNRLDLL